LVFLIVFGPPGGLSAQNPNTRDGSWERVKRDASGNLLPPKNLIPWDSQQDDSTSAGNVRDSDDEDDMNPRYALQLRDENGDMLPHSCRILGFSRVVTPEPMDTVMARSVGGGPAPPAPAAAAAAAPAAAAAAAPTAAATAAAAAAASGPSGSAGGAARPSTAAAAAAAAAADADPETPTGVLRPPVASANAPMRSRHFAAYDLGDIDHNTEVSMIQAFNEVESGGVSQIETKLGEKILTWNAANVRRNARCFSMWPVCHLIDNKLLVGVTKSQNGQHPSVVFFLKNDSVPLEFNNSSIPISPAGFGVLSREGPKFRDWIFQVDKVSHLMKLQGAQRLSPEQFSQLMHLKPADVYLEDSIRLPAMTAAGGNLENKALMAGAPGSVKLSCFLNQKFDVCGTVVLRFAQSAEENPDERVIFMQGSVFALFVDGAIPFIKQCVDILEDATDELEREYGM